MAIPRNDELRRAVPSQLACLINVYLGDYDHCRDTDLEHLENSELIKMAKRGRPECTDRGEAYVKGLCAVPPPVAEWTIKYPEKKKD